MQKCIAVLLMANALTFRITVLAVVILGILSTIIAAAGNVWLKQHVGNIKRFMGLWKTCLKIEGLDSVCSTYKLISSRSSTKGKLFTEIT